MTNLQVKLMDLEAEIKKRWPLILILIFAFSIRTYFVNKNIALWWDEAQYMLGARAYARGTPSGVWQGRAFLFPLMLSPVAESEIGAKMIEIFFSLGTIVLIYLFCEKYLDKKTAFFSALIMSSFWLDLFYSVRVLTGIPASFFLLLSMFLFFDKGKNLKKTFFSALFFAAAFIIRFPSAIAIFVIIIYGLFTKEYRNKSFYMWFVFLAVCTTPLFIHDAVVYGDAFTTTRTFIETNLRFDSTGATTDQPWNFYLLIFPDILTPVFNVFFWIGMFLLITNIKKKKSLFLILYFSIMLIALSSLTNKQDRFLIPVLPVIAIIGILGLVKITGIIGSLFKLNKMINLIIVSLIAAVTMFGITGLMKGQLISGAELITEKAESYAEIRYAGEWVRENSSPDAIIATVSGPQIKYYSDREITGFKQTVEEFTEEIENKEVDFYVTSRYEPMPDFMGGDLSEYGLVIGKMWTESVEGLEYPIAIVWVNPN